MHSDSAGQELVRAYLKQAVGVGGDDNIMPSISIILWNDLQLEKDTLQYINLLLSTKSLRTSVINIRVHL